MKKIITLIFLAAIIIMPAFAMGSASEKTEEAKPDTVTTASEYKEPETKKEESKIDLSGKKILMIVASKDFNDKEYFVPRNIFEEHGAKVIVASSKEDVVSANGTKIKADILLKNVKVRDYNAVVFIGGPGAKEYFNNEKAHYIATWSFGLRKPVAAICLAPVILAHSGILSGRKATVIASETDTITNEGAIYTGSDVEVFGNTITANSSDAAEKFAKAIVNALSK
ncbi:DJ-1/PfpI family protein [Candidatus Margulisiibacteriota bacterium]